MMILENVRLALFSLKANKMRALLTMLGIIIGIASVIAIMTVGTSMTSSVTDSMNSMGANNITVGVQQKMEEEEQMGDGMEFDGMIEMKAPEEEDYITKEMLEAYCSAYAEFISAISASESAGNGKIQDGSRYANISVMGVSAGYFLANDTNILQGRLFSEKEMKEGKMVALISDKAVNNLFGGDTDAAVGSTIQVSLNNKYYSYVVVGVYQYEQSMMGFSSSSDKDITTNCFIPLKNAHVR